MKTELIAKMEELLSKDAGEVAAQVRTLQKEYQKATATEQEAARQEYIRDGGDPKEFAYTAQAEDARFEELVEQHNRARKELEAKLAMEHARNLTIRQEIIAKIRDLSQVSENVGAAIRKLQELQAQWKETGPVSPHKYKEVQSEYSKAIEDIYYNIKIYRDLQEHDLRKNLEMKTALIGKFKGLLEMENIKEAERLIKVYRNEWDEIGPVPNMRWESLKQEYRAVLEEAYAKIKSHYKGLEEKKEASLNSKLDIIAKAQELVENIASLTSAQQWNDATDKVLAYQSDWKLAGRTSEKENEKTWAEFRTWCDKFFDAKKEFFKGLNEKFSENRKLKMGLIQKAEALQNSTDWQKTASDLIRLQDEWKKHPSNGDKEESKLYHRFRNACNHFFDARKKSQEDRDLAFVDNLKVKEGILERITAFTIPADIQEARAELKKFTDEWNQAGMVPMKDKKRVNDAFYSRLDDLYEQLNIDKAEKAMIQFKTKIEKLASSEGAMDLLRKESDHLRKMIDEINGRVRTYENNLGFFKTSKGSNAFMAEVEEKINAEKAKMAELTSRRKLVNEEINKIREKVNA